jgi:hypothetical protein
MIVKNLPFAVDHLELAKEKFLPIFYQLSLLKGDSLAQ